MPETSGLMKGAFRYTGAQQPLANLEFLIHDVHAKRIDDHNCQPQKSSHAGRSPSEFVEDANHTYAVSSPASWDSFAYSPFPDRTEHNLRLLQIEPVRHVQNEDIHCTLRCTLLSQSNNLYKCLSYCWGSTSKFRHIFIRMDGESTHRVFPVTENLWSALRMLRDAHNVSWLWIDAICINQNDHPERAVQVRMMKEIYSSSSEVLIWLGDTSPGLSSAVSVILAISQHFESRTSRKSGSIIDPDGLMLMEEEIRILETFTSELILGMPRKAAYKYIALFFALPWFRRVWVLQEVFSNASITVHLGSHSFTWGSVVLAALWQSFLARDFTANYENSATENDSYGYLPELWLGLFHRRIPKGLSMTELVFRAREFQATDSRDKVFGLLGMANDISPEFRRSFIDYSKTKEDVYCELAKAVITTSGSLDILSAVDTFTGPSIREGISWRSDFDISVAAIRGLGFPRKYNASFSTDALVGVTQDSANVLSLSGFTIDAITELVPDTFTLGPGLKIHLGDDPDAVHTLWRNIIKRRDYYKDFPEKTLLECYLHTLTAAGFALLGDFSSHTIRRVVPPNHVPSLFADLAAYWVRVEPSCTSFENSEEMCKLAMAGDAHQFAVVAGKACHERKFFFTKDGRMGLCPRNAECGDSIAILYGGSVPYVLREVSRRTWNFVGECYVEGMMFGEAEEIRRRRGILDQVFDIH